MICVPHGPSREPARAGERSTMRGREVRRGMSVAVLLAVFAAGSTAAEGALTHRVWLLNGVPGETTLAALRAAGVGGLVVPVGEVGVSGDSSRLTLAPLPDLKVAAGMAVAPLVWVAGEGDARGNAEQLVGELAPVRRLLPGSTSLLLAARSVWPGLSGFAGAVAEAAKVSVELVVPASALARLETAGLPRGVRLAVVAFGNPLALGFPSSTLADDLDALARLDSSPTRYRVVLVVSPRSVPPPGTAGVSLAAVALPSVADYRPADRGDAFVLRQPVDWGGTMLAPHDSVQVELVDTARYDRDLGLSLRSVRPHLEGWDTAGLPDGEPTLGMSREAFLDYLQGGQPFPTPQVRAAWVTPTRLSVALANATPQASALASTGNWVELRFSAAPLLDVALGDFSGADYGRTEAGGWRRTIARDATALRLYLTYLPPASRLGGAAVSFMARPSDVSVRWVLRLGDGREVTGPLEPLPFTKP
jgi:hypothetical protein